MKILFTLLTAFFLLSVVSYGTEQQAKIAKVNYSEIDDLLEAIVLARPENKDLSTRYRELQKKNEAAQKKMQKAFMSGEKINPMEAASDMIHSSEEHKKVDMLCDKLALQVIEKVIADKYQIVLKSNYRSSLLYSKVSIDDVTSLIRQELLRQLPEKE